MKFRPLADRIVVRRVQAKEQTAGGIFIPDNAKEKPVEGFVVAVGPGRVNREGNVIPIDIKEGDTVMFGKYSGTEIKINNEDHVVLREEDVLGVVLES